MIFHQKTALIYCDDQLGKVDGKTAAGLVRQSDLYTIVGVIDHSLAGKDAGEEVGYKKCHIPIFYDLQDALDSLPSIPDCYIYGKAPLEAFISLEERQLILEAMAQGMDIINGLHEFFSDDPEFLAQSIRYGVSIKDIRKPPQVKDLHVFSGEIAQVNIPVIAVLGTDCACGKMTTAVELNKALNTMGIKSVLVATGQTSLMQGAKYGIAIDALVSQFVIGEIEHAIVEAFTQENPDLILVEGQSSLSHPAFMSSMGILKGSMPDAVILQHPPSRKFRCDFPNLLMPTVAEEIALIESISLSKVIAITLSHENLTSPEVSAIIAYYEDYFRLPTTDVLQEGCQKLVRALLTGFPKLKLKIKKEALHLVPHLIGK